MEKETEKKLEEQRLFEEELQKDIEKLKEKEEPIIKESKRFVDIPMDMLRKIHTAYIQRLKGLDTPTSDTDGANKKYVDDNAGESDHGLLTGLTDDDHEQYYGSGIREPDHGALGGLDDNDHGAVYYTKTEVDTLDGQNVKKTGDQTIAGVKTFSSFPVTPSSAPSTDYQVSNKKYVDDAAGGTQLVANDDNIINLHTGLLLHQNADARQITAPTGAYTKIKESTIGLGGEFRIKWTVAVGTGTVNTKVYRNGVSVGVVKSGIGIKEDDVNGWKAGDKIQIYVLCSDGDPNTVTVSALEIYGKWGVATGGY